MFVTRNVFAESQSSGEFFWHENWRWPNWTLGPGTQGQGHGMDAVFVCKSVVESLLSPFSYLILRRITSWGSGLPKLCIPQKRNEKVWKRSKLVRKNHAWPISLRAVRGLSCGLKKTPRFICSHVLVGSGSLPLHACKSPWGSIAFARESSGPLFCSGGALNRTSLSSRFLTGTLVLGVPDDTLGQLGRTRPITAEPVLRLGNHSLSTLHASLSEPPGRVPMFARGPAGGPAPVGFRRVASQTSNCPE